MIKNERQYHITKAQLEKFERSLANLLKQPPADTHPTLLKAREDALRHQIREFEVELADYEALRDGRLKLIQMNSLAELPRGLIAARIAAGLSQRDLAERMGLKEQQIQRYESTEYASASWRRIGEVAAAIGLQGREEFYLPIASLS